MPARVCQDSPLRLFAAALSISGALAPHGGLDLPLSPVRSSRALNAWKHEQCFRTVGRRVAISGRHKPRVCDARKCSLNRQFGLVRANRALVACSPFDETTGWLATLLPSPRPRPAHGPRQVHGRNHYRPGVEQAAPSDARSGWLPIGPPQEPAEDKPPLKVAATAGQLPISIAENE